MVAASTCTSISQDSAATGGTLQELRIRCGKPTPYYLDSSSTVFVATDDKSVKKSVWLIRRAAVLRDGVVYNEILPVHIREYKVNRRAACACRPSPATRRGRPLSGLELYMYMYMYMYLYWSYKG